jgi:hypothetical protein
MAHHPSDRLARRLPGEKLRAEITAVERLLERGDAPAERPDPVPARDRAELRVPVVRATRRTATTGPNAPLLKRLVVHPYGLHPTGRTRVRIVPEAPPADKLVPRDEIAAALADRQRVRSTSAGRTRPRPFAVRPSTWRLLPPSTDPDA